MNHNKVFTSFELIEKVQNAVPIWSIPNKGNPCSRKPIHDPVKSNSLLANDSTTFLFRIKGGKN
jgi:hypothetical protein